MQIRRSVISHLQEELIKHLIVSRPSLTHRAISRRKVIISAE